MNFQLNDPKTKVQKMSSSKIVTIPNLLTFLRLALIPVFAVTLFYSYNFAALLLFFFAGISDMFDGMIARRFSMESSLGTILDPIADKLLMTVTFVMLTLPNILPVQHRVPFWVTASVIGRDVLIIAVAVAINMVTGFRKFKPSLLGKISTVVQLCGVGLILIALVFKFTFYLPTIYTLITLMAVISGVQYIFHVAKLMREAEVESTPR